MQDEGDNPKQYSPKEVAKFFGITVGALRNRRKRGQIEGIRITENYYVYTQEQIDKADINAIRRRGPKPKEQGDNRPEKQVA